MKMRGLLSFVCLLWVAAVHAHPSDMLERMALVDTGYDACVQAGGTQCEANKNLLFRGDQPIADEPPTDFEFDYFQQTALQYLQKAQAFYQIDAPLPVSLAASLARIARGRCR